MLKFYEIINYSENYCFVILIMEYNLEKDLTTPPTHTHTMPYAGQRTACIVHRVSGLDPVMDYTILRNYDNSLNNTGLCFVILIVLTLYKVMLKGNK